ncbi:zinc-dependent metalloprotease [Cryomorphaceae bacterium 1068]|nr:zinc-dependent metalloprotease [Cryomorphaceae bacterium 1068]
MKNANYNKAVFRWVGILCLSIMGFSSIQAQSLLTNVGDPGLDREQGHFLKTVTDNAMNHSLEFVEVNLEALKGNSFTFQPNKHESYTVIKNERGENYASLVSWCGSINTEQEFGDVNMVINGDELVAHFTLGTRIFALTPLGKGLHVFYEVDSSMMPKEDCEHGDTELDYDYVPDKEGIPQNEDMLWEDIGLPKATGECKIRVLVGFTTSAQGQYTSILAELANQVNLANAAYDNAQVGFNIELAMAYNVGYTESGDLGTDLSRWRATSDGFMDDVHSNRTLFDADMCALIVNDGGGIAYLSLDYEDTFSVTGTGNFGVFTFHHELGHNMLCTHDLVNPTQPGTAPYAGYGEPTVGCFRTIMAYQPACGTGACGRVNVFSRSVGTYTCGGTAYAKGGPNNRNRDRLVLSKNATNNHTTVLANATYGADYNWFNQEAINFVAEETVGYSSAVNNWEMFSGSEGSFRASDEVTLGEGFWARSGSTFTAYLESCTDISPDAAALAIVDPGYEPTEESVSPISDAPAEGSKFFHDLTVFPNPFIESTTVQFNFHGDKRVSITLMDILGREMMQIANAVEFAEGQHRIEIQTSDLPTGIYLITLRAGDDVMVKRIIKGN